MLSIQEPGAHLSIFKFKMSVNVAADRHQRDVVEGSDVRGRRLIAPSTDILLGKVTVPLLLLLTRTTGSLSCSKSLVYSLCCSVEHIIVYVYYQ